MANELQLRYNEGNTRFYKEGQVDKEPCTIKLQNNFRLNFILGKKYSSPLINIPY